MKPKRTKTTFRSEDFDFVYDLDPNMGGGEWEAVANWCVDNVGHEDAFIDVGAYIGYMSVMVAHFAKPRLVVAVEPDPKTAQILEENLNLYTNCLVVQESISDEIGEKKVYLNLDNPAQNSFYPRYDLQHKNTIRTSTTTIDEMLTRLMIEPPVVLKIDTEFAEPLVWQGMKKSLDKIKCFVMEYQPVHLYKFTKQDPNALVNEIKAYGFRDEVVGNNLAFYKI